MKYSALLIGLALVATANPAVARGWQRSAPFNVWADGYKFHRVDVKNMSMGCKVTIAVQFKSPNTRYVRFQAKVTFKSGAWVRTSIFHNEHAGWRQFTYQHETKNQGCWGNRAQTPSYLQVSYCYGRNCTVPPVGKK